MARAKNDTSAGVRGSRAEELILGVPGRLMVPRLILIASVITLVVFGLVMIYSASSVTALASTGDAAYYLIRQGAFIAVGIVITIILAIIDYHILAKQLLPVAWILTVALLVIVLVRGAGSETLGASRWFLIGSFTLQPSEFAKITLVLVGANLMNAYFVEHSIDFRGFAVLGGIGIGIPALLIVAQPDKGTTLVILAALVVMAILSGLELRYILIISGIGAAVVVFLIFKDSYSVSRVNAMLDPFEDLYAGGWQLAQGYYAFGSGGLFGVGLGMSRQKYSYLPFAYNDFIFAVIGEELGLVGTVALVLLFVILAWAGYRIARYAPDLTGRLIAVGCTSILWIQMLINVCGVIGLIPLSGKPVPFVSYGGSSIMSSLMLIGLVVSVSRRSKLPETVHDEYRSSFRVTSADDGSTAGEPTRRSERTNRGARSLTLVNGGNAGSGRSASTRRNTRYERVDLGPTAAERLRNRGKRDR